MSKEREDFNALFPQDRLEKVKDSVAIEAAFEGYLLGRAHYQPLLAANDLEIESAHKLIVDMGDDFLELDKEMEAQKKLLERMAGLLWKNKDELYHYTEGFSVLWGEVDKVLEDYAAINAATGEK